MSWEVETIGDDQLLFMRAHRVHFQDGVLQPGVFRDQGASMSTNWQKYCHTADECRAKSKIPADNAVLTAVVAPVRQLRLEVNHSPIQDGCEAPVAPDRSHTDVIGTKTTEVRLDLHDIFAIALPIENV